MKLNRALIGLAAVAALTAGPAFAACDPGEMVIKFSHVTNIGQTP